MKFSHFFIDRPRFATVLSGLIVIMGLIAYLNLPVSRYPEISPPQVEVTASYPGANAETVAQTVATPLEQEINGVEGMLYLSSQSTNDGRLTIRVTFKSGTDIDTAQVLVQNRVSAAEPRLPESVRRQGISTNKVSPDILLAINLYSPDEVLDQNYIANYAVLNVRDRIKRLPGIGNSTMFGGGEYAMRIWFDTDKLSAYSLTPDDIIGAMRAQNIQMAGGILNQYTGQEQDAFELSIESRGRFLSIEEFEKVIVKRGDNGSLVHLKDVARIELGSSDYSTKGYINGTSSVIVATFLRPGANALDTADVVVSTMEEIAKDFPPGLAYQITYNPTKYIDKSIDEVYKTLFEAVVLVIVVILFFLQDWRTTIVPIVAIPISLIGTFALMQAFGYSLNTLSLFGLVLAIGIVVDDAIVVVENVERKLQEGLGIIDATKQTMDEVGSALIAIALVLVAVFLPSVMLEGIEGQFYKQFGVTIASATVISAIVSLTLSPALAAILMKNVGRHESRNWFARLFNKGMDRFAGGYAWAVSKLVRMTLIMSLLYVGLIAITGQQFMSLPKGFIPAQDQGYLITIVQLPSGASLQRTDKVVKQINTLLEDVEGVKDVVAFTGYSPATSTIASNAAAVFAILDPMEQREPLATVLARVNQQLSAVDSAFVITVPPPSVRGMGNAGGFKMMVQDRANMGPKALEEATRSLAMAANQSQEISRAFSFFDTSTPRVRLDIDRERARQLNVPIENITSTLETLFGSSYVNDFSFLGRSFRVIAQADSQFRRLPEHIENVEVRASNGQMISLNNLITTSSTSGPTRIPHYNLYPSAGISGSTSAGYSSGEALSKMEALAEEVLPTGFGYEWTEIAYLEKQQGNSAIFIFLLSVLFVFLLLSAQYESWTLPLSIVLIVPMCILSATLGLFIASMDNNILTQVGLVVLVGLASKNAILLVEFAKHKEETDGITAKEAAVYAAKTRLRPILMTALAFIFGVIPLLYSTGPGFEMRQAIGVTVFSGMLGVTLFGLLFTPAFYVLCRKLVVRPEKPAAALQAEH